jgi:hypothetical protein
MVFARHSCTPVAAKKPAAAVVQGALSQSPAGVR